MAEWSIAAVLKTVELRGSGGSNPSLSANDRKVGWKVCQNSHLLFYAQSPDFHKLGLCYNLKILYL